MPISLLNDKEIGERKRSKGLLLLKSGYRPLEPLFQPRFKDEVGLHAKLNQTPDYPLRTVGLFWSNGRGVFIKR